MSGPVYPKCNLNLSFEVYNIWAFHTEDMAEEAE
jgi:hypothetical protein